MSSQEGRGEVQRPRMPFPDLHRLQDAIEEAEASPLASSSPALPSAASPSADADAKAPAKKKKKKKKTTTTRSGAEDGGEEEKRRRRRVEEETHSLELLNKRVRMAELKRQETEAVLEDMNAIILRLSDVSQDIGRELDVHNEIIQEQSVEIEEAHDRLTRLNMKIDRMLTDTGCSHTTIILILSVLALFLVLLIVVS